MKRWHLLFLLLPLIALADSEKFPYTCDNGSRIEISFSSPSDGRPQAILHFADSHLTLPQIAAASGAAYKQDGIGLHTKDDEAIFEDGKGNVRHCLRGTNGSAKADSQTTASSFIEISGSVTYHLRMALPADALLILRVQETARRGTHARTLAEQSIALESQQVPIAFQIMVDRDLLSKKAQLIVSARIERAGKLLFINDKTYPALNNGQPKPLEIILKPMSPTRKKS